MSIKAPEGTHDLLPDEAQFWNRFQRIAEKTFGFYGYQPIYTPIIEQTELFVRGIGEATDVVSKEMFTAISGENLAKLLAGERLKSGSRLSLRPEGTAGTVRAVVQHDLVPQGAPPVKLMYSGPMFRAERPQRGRFRQFNQIGIECLGSEDPAIDAEAVIMLMRFYRLIGISRESLVLLVNSMGCDKCRPAYRAKLKEYMEANSDRFCGSCQIRMNDNPLRAFDCKNEECRAVMADAPKISDHLCTDCREHYERFLSYLKMVGLDYVEDPTLVRGLDYYTRTVFEIQTTDSASAQNAIGGGGRYDKLAEEVGGKPTPGFGFALGYERCVLALQDQGFEFPSVSKCDVFIASVGDEVLKDVFIFAQNLRDNDYVCEYDHQGRSLKSQFKLADKLGAKVVVIIGPDELANGMIRIRNMSSHEEMDVSIDVALAVVVEQIGYEE